MKNIENVLIENILTELKKVWDYFEVIEMKHLASIISDKDFEYLEKEYSKALLKTVNVMKELDKVYPPSNESPNSEIISHNDFRTINSYIGEFTEDNEAMEKLILDANM